MQGALSRPEPSFDDFWTMNRAQVVNTVEHIAASHAGSK